MSRYTRMRVEDMPSIPVGAKQSSSKGIVSDLWYLLLDAAMKTITYDETQWRLVPVEMHTAQANAGWRALATQGIEPEDVELDPVYKAMLAAAPQPPVVNQPLTTEQPASVAPPALYQHDDGRYALALGDVARHKLTDSDPAWHRVPLDVVVTTTETEE